MAILLTDSVYNGEPIGNTEDGILSIPLAWISLILNIPLYFGLYVYLDQILPNTFGIKKDCCFCLKKSRRR